MLGLFAMCIHLKSGSVLLACTIVLGCSESTTPDDPSPVSIALPANSRVAALAASEDRLYSLRLGSATSRVLEARRLDGAVEWAESVPSCGTGQQCALAVDASNNLYLATGTGLMSRTSSGSLRWTVTTHVASIAIGSGSRLFVTGRPFVAQSVYAIEKANGATAWTAALPASFDAMATLLDESRSTVYSIGRGGAVAMDTQTGAVRWTVTHANCFAHSVGSIANDGTLYVNCDSDFSSRLNAYTPAGILKWQRSLGSTVGTFAPVIDADGTVYVANAGSVRAISPAGSVVWTVSNLAMIRGSPILDSNRNIYVFASQTGSGGEQTLLVLKNGTITEDRGPASCEDSILLLPTGRAYCSAFNALIRFGTEGYPSDAQWGQFGHNYRRTSHR